MKKVITKPMEKEIEAARKLKKPILVFLHDDSQNRHAKNIIRRLGTKYKTFLDLDELNDGVKTALINELIYGYKEGGKIKKS